MKKELLMIAIGGVTSIAVQQGLGSDLGPDADRLYESVKQLDVNSWPILNREINKSTEDLTRLPQDMIIRLAAVGAGLGDLSMQAEMVRRMYDTPYWDEIGLVWLDEVLSSSDVAIIKSLDRFFSDKYENEISNRIQKRLKELEPPPPPPAPTPVVVQKVIERVVEKVVEKPEEDNVQMVGVLRTDWVDAVVMSRMEFISSRRTSLQSLSDVYADYINELGSRRQKTKLQLLQEIKADIDGYSPRALKLLSVGVHPSQPFIEMNVAYVFKADKRSAARTRAKDRSGYLKINFLLNEKGKVIAMKTVDSKIKPELSSEFIHYSYGGDETVLGE